MRFREPHPNLTEKTQQNKCWWRLVRLVRPFHPYTCARTVCDEEGRKKPTDWPGSTTRGTHRLPAVRFKVSLKSTFAGSNGHWEELRRARHRPAAGGVPTPAARSGSSATCSGCWRPSRSQTTCARVCDSTRPGRGAAVGGRAGQRSRTGSRRRQPACQDLPAEVANGVRAVARG